MDIEKLYHTYYMDVYSYMMTLAKDAHMAEEITQEVFFKYILYEFTIIFCCHVLPSFPESSVWPGDRLRVPRLRFTDMALCHCQKYLYG